MKKRVMTVDELYSFCLQNNFSKFTSNESGTELVVEMPGHFEKDTKDESLFTEGMTPFVSRAFHDKVNLNKSKIETEVFENNLPSSHLRPILANIVKDEETGLLDFGSHDFHIEKVVEKDKDGNSVEVEKTVYDEQPIGVIDGSRNAIEYDEKADVNRAVLHGYLYNEYCQDAIDILNRRGTVDCSVELSIRSMSFDGVEKVLVLDDFYVSALTLLSEKTMPGMVGSNFKIEDFASKNDFKFDKNEKLIELLENLNKTLSNFNKEQNPSVQTQSKEGGINNDMTKFEELLTKYGKTAEDVTFDYAEMSDEELEAKFAEMFDDNSDGNSSDDEKSDEPSNGGEGAESESNTNEDFSKDELFNKLFEISFDEIRYALNTLCSVYRNDSEWCYVSQVYEEYFIMEDWDNNKFYKQSYTKDGDNVALSGERIEMFAMLLTESEKISIEEMRSNYTELKEFKENVEKNELHSKKESLLADEKYSVLSENEEFTELKKNMDNYSLDDLETKAKVIFADYVSSIGAFSAKPEVSKSPVLFMSNSNSEKESKKKAPYGGIFEKYNN